MVPLTALWLVKDADSSQGLSYSLSFSFWIYIGVHMIATTYSYIWDIYMDWGLFRLNTKGHPNRFLREKINYQPTFYYFAIISNFFLRYIFILGLFALGNQDSLFNELKGITGVLIAAEAIRRAQWALLRVENEQNNNLETYRTIPIIPPIVNSKEAVGKQDWNLINFWQKSQKNLVSLLSYGHISPSNNSKI